MTNITYQSHIINLNAIIHDHNNYLQYNFDEELKSLHVSQCNFLWQFGWECL